MMATAPRQLTPRAVFLGMLLSVVLGAANAYLGLFAGLTVSASIPAAVISMGVFRLFRGASILENNIVQTAASSGEAVAAGAIFTLPALVLLHYWQGFPQTTVMLITGVGGLLGVLLTIPLRHALVGEEGLPFPEGTATAAVLQVGADASRGLRALAAGGVAGALAKLAESGLHLWPATLEGARRVGRGVFYGGVELSPALLAVGYIVGPNVAFLVFAGGATAWWIAIPVCLMAGLGTPDAGGSWVQLAYHVWSQQVRYLGVGAMVVGGVWALWSMRGALLRGMASAAGVVGGGREDLPRSLTLGLTALLLVPMYLFYRHVLGGALAAVPLTAAMALAALLFSAVAAYMAGLVGSSNNPVSGVTLATILLTALGLYWCLGETRAGPVSAVLVGAVVCCAAAIGGDNMQDLKAGALVGASPWRQQLAQMLGVLSSMCVLAPILSLLLDAYGIGVPTAAHPHPLPAPQASLMAAVARGVFGGHLPWHMVLAGGLLGVGVIGVDEWLRLRGSRVRAPILAVAVGLYLPFALSIPIALGGLAALRRRGAAMGGDGLLLAAGLITGEALAGIALAAVIVLGRAHRLPGSGLLPWGGAIGAGLFALVLVWLLRVGARTH